MCLEDLHKWWVLFKNIKFKKGCSGTGQNPTMYRHLKNTVINEFIWAAGWLLKGSGI